MKRPLRLLGLVPSIVLLLVSLTPVATAATPHRARVDKAVQQLVDKGAEKIGVILHFADAPTDADGRDLLKSGFLPGMIRYKIIPAAFAVGTPQAIEAATRNPRITFVEHDAEIPYALDRATVVGRARQTWDAIYKLNEDVHTDGITGRGVGIAIVDTGIDATHPDLLWEPFAQAPSPLAAKTIANYKIEGRDSARAFSVPADPFLEANQLAVNVPHSDNTGGHGTHVAGIAGGNGASSEGKFKGAAPGADLIGYGAGEVLVVSMGLAAFDHIHLNHEELGIRVVNNSWGGAGEWRPELAVTQAARRLVNDDGLVVVFAAGNSGGDGTTLQTSVWGNIPEVIQVASYYDRTGDTSSFSSRGLRDRVDTWPDLAAPGEQIISTGAAGGPVSYVCTGQDAVLSQFLGPDDTIVVTVPVPTTVGDDDVLVGNYASCSGTSMASPFVAGVSALILEANPALNPFEVRDILRETANMLPGRTYENDGFAIGKGVVDAAEAVAVALKMREGLSLIEALGASLVDSDGSPYEINMVDPRHLEISSPIAGTEVKSPIQVTGALVDGPVTDNTIPLLPVPGSPVTGSPNIYIAGAINPFAITPQLMTLVPGEPVELAIRFISSSDGSIVLAPGQSGRHVVRKGATVIFNETTASAPDSSVGTPNGFTTNTAWEVPLNALGSYVFEGYLTVNGVEYETGALPFSVIAPVSPQTAPAPTSPNTSKIGPNVGAPGGLGAQSSVLSDGFEDGAEGWAVEQNGFGPGLLTDWQRVGTAPLRISFNGGAHTGAAWFQAGANDTAPIVNGLHYTDMADTTLVSPLIDLTESTSAALNYWRAGGSEFDFDFLTAFVDPEGAAEPVELEKLSGDIFNSEVFGSTGPRSWQQSPTFDLSAFLGQQVRLRFQFTSDDATIGINTPGWSIDDIEVVATSDGGGGGEPELGEAILSATPLEGVGSLTTTFTYGYTGTGASSFTLDFGDGTAAHNATLPGTVEHTYSAPGSYEAVLTVKDSAGAILDVGSAFVEVAPIDVVQLRVSHAEGATPWKNAPRDGAGAFDTTLDLGSLLGPAKIEARHFGVDGRQLVKSVDVVVIPSNLPPVAIDDAFDAHGETVLDVLANDSDPYGDVLSISSAESTSGTDLVTDQGGTLVIENDKITYTPPTNYTGPDAFEYTISDPLGLTDTALVSLSVTRVEVAPVAENDTANATGSVVIPVLNNDSDANGDALTVSDARSTSDTPGVSDQGGKLTITDDSKILYEAPERFEGEDRFLYTVTDPTGLSDNAQVTLTVTLPPASPQCGLIAKGEVTLTADILNCRGDGIVVVASGTTIDFAGHKVTGTGKSGSTGVSAPGLSKVTITGGTVEGFDVGIDLASATRSTVSAMKVMENTSIGVRATGANNVVSGVVLDANGDGIVASGSGVTLKGNNVDHSTGVGIAYLGGDKAKITSNFVRNSTSDGISVGAAVTNVTLKSNNVSDNGGDGMKVGADSTTTSVRIEGTSATDNTLFGIRAVPGPRLRAKNNFASGNNAGGEQCEPDGIC